MKRCALLSRPGRVALESASVRSYLLSRGLLAESKTKFQKAKAQQFAVAGPSVQNPIVEGSNHGISQV